MHAAASGRPQSYLVEHAVRALSSGPLKGFGGRSIIALPRPGRTGARRAAEVRHAMETVPVQPTAAATASAASPEQAGSSRPAAGARIVARAVERLSEQRYLLARDGRVFLAQSATELPTGRELRLFLARPGKPALLSPVPPGQGGGLGSAQVSGHVRPAGAGQLLLSTALGEELVRVTPGEVPAGQGRFRVLEPAVPALVRLQAEVAGQTARSQPAAPTPESGRTGLLAALLRHFLPQRQSPAEVLSGARQLLAESGARRGGGLGSEASAKAFLQALLADEVWRPEEGPASLRAHLREGGGRLGSRLLAELLGSRSQPGSGFAAWLAKTMGDPNAPGGREAWQRLGEALLGEEFNGASRSDAAQLGLVVPEGRQLRDVWLRWGDGRSRRRRPGSAVRKLAVGVDFSATGRVRADLLWSAERMRVRLRAERPDVAERLRVDRPHIEALLSQGGAEVALSIEHGAAHPPGKPDADQPLLERTG
jgi:hypothetical protein